MRYRYQRAALAGSRFGIWLARVFGVKPVIVKADMTPEEVAKMKEMTRPLDIQDVLPNGEDD